MEIKTFEIRDRMTFIPVMAIQLEPSCDREKFLLAKAGFGNTSDKQSEYIILIHLTRAESKIDPYHWNDRTMKTAHEYLLENFPRHLSGDVIDVEYILGESKEKKVSEYFDKE